MKRIDTSTKAVDLFGAGKHGFKNGNKALGIVATDFNADWTNHVQEEVANVIEGAGIALDGAQYNQLYLAIQRMINGGDYKQSCRVASTVNLAALSGLLTIDGVVLLAGDRVLVKDQTVGSQNGIYIAAAGAWSRAIDADADGELSPATIFPVEEGAVNADTLWLLTNDGTVTIGTTALTFARKDSQQSYISGTMLHWPSMTAPSWALVRDGSAVSRTAYATLFNILCPTQNGTLTNGANAVTGLTSTRQMAVGMKIEGTGVPANTTIASITGATSITLSANATVSGAQSLRLFPYGNGDGATTFNVMDDREVFERGYAATPAGNDKTVLTGNTTNASNVITNLSSTTGIYIGQAVSGTGIPGGATVASITSMTTITISSNATATGAGVSLTFTGRPFGQVQADDFASHIHAQHPATAVGIGSGITLTAGGSNWSQGNNTQATGGAETRPRNRAYLPIIVY